jgi:hypothetical protein
MLRGCLLYDYQACNAAISAEEKNIRGEMRDVVKAPVKTGGV